MDIQYTLWIISACAQCILVVMLCARRMVVRYLMFSAYLAATAISGFILRSIGRIDAASYAVAWAITEPTLMILLVCSVRELVRKFPERYPHFGSFGRAKLRRLLEIAVSIALISTLLEAAGPQWNYSLVTWIPVVIALKRIVTTVIAGYLLLLTVFTIRFPAPLERNLKVHMRLLAAYASLTSAVMLWQNTAARGHGTRFSNVVLLSATSALYLLWTCLLTRDGDVPPSMYIASEDEISSSVLYEKELREIATRYSGRRFR